MRFLVVPGVLSEVEVTFHAAALHGVYQARQAAGPGRARRASRARTPRAAGPVTADAVVLYTVLAAGLAIVCGG